MGCFSITAQKARKKLTHQTQLPQPKPCVSYHNKPTVLPHPQEVEQGRYTRTLSTPAQFQFVKAAARSPCVYRQSRALSAPARVTLHDPYAPPVAVAVAVADDAQPPSSPLSNRILPLSDPALCEKINRKAFGGRPVPLPSPLPLPLAAHPLPLPKGNHPSLSETITHNSAALLAFSPSRCSTPSREGNGRLVDNDIRLSSSLQPKPLPQPPPETNTFAVSPRVFTFNELAAASQNFSPDCCIGDTGNAIAYRSWISTEGNARKKTEVSVLQLTTPPTFRDPKDFVVEATKMCSLQHPHLCKLIGFCTEDSPQPKGISNKKKTQFLVFESLPKGTAKKLLYGRQEGGLLDWSTRVKIGVGAAKGLAYLHEHPSGEILYRDFCTFNIQIDQEFNPKLTGYGFVNRCPNKLLPVTAHVSPETAANGRVSPKSNVWSFGVVLLELLTGRRNLDAISLPEEQDLVHWLKKFAADCSRLYRGMDPELKGCYPVQDVKLVADLALKCLHQEPDLRPSMKEVVEILAFVEDRSSTRVKCPQENADMHTNLSFKPFLNPFGKQGFLSSEYKATVSEAS